MSSEGDSVSLGPLSVSSTFSSMANDRMSGGPHKDLAPVERLPAGARCLRRLGTLGAAGLAADHHAHSRARARPEDTGKGAKDKAFRRAFLPQLRIAAQALDGEDHGQSLRP